MANEFRRFLAALPYLFLYDGALVRTIQLKLDEWCEYGEIQLDDWCDYFEILRTSKL